ncbi:hypothetical protein E8E13_002654 [Curvularia kusanoi]|uniref:non-specific serine/threonine protein kinase n=1 Tax=Curvularia kusanoi TaxID=90978 RepID=A0A9P4TL13_CURKU|nr:hypothetical protein E8E13_002654 [Curvularia kusanoi]
MDDRTPPGSRWQPEKTLYIGRHVPLSQGGFCERIVHLVVRLDENDNIQERMIVKVLGDGDLENLRYHVGNEVGPHKRLAALGSNYIIGYIADSERRREVVPHLAYIYSEYAPYGDLKGLWEKVHSDPDMKQLPEPYVWHIFRALAEGLHAMHYGVVPGPGVSSEDLGEVKEPWRSIIDPDIKLENFVVCEPQADYYPTYKTIKKIDFGCVIPESLMDGEEVDLQVLNEHSGGQIGTAEFWPPEQHRPALEEYKNVTIGVWSEIYNIGLIIYSLMEGKLAQRIKKYPLEWRPYGKCYSRQLSKLVEDCLSSEHEQRPSLKALIKAINMGLEDWEEAYGSADVADPPEYMRYDRFEEPRYPIGSKAPMVPGEPRKRKSEEVMVRARSAARFKDPFSPPAKRVKSSSTVSSHETSAEPQSLGEQVQRGEGRKAKIALDASAKRFRNVGESSSVQIEESDPEESDQEASDLEASYSVVSDSEVSGSEEPDSEESETEQPDPEESDPETSDQDSEWDPVSEFMPQPKWADAEYETLGAYDSGSEASDRP